MCGRVTSELWLWRDQVQLSEGGKMAWVDNTLHQRLQEQCYVIIIVLKSIIVLNHFLACIIK